MKSCTTGSYFRESPSVIGGLEYQSMDLSVVILNYNSEGFLECCLDSIRRLYPDRLLEIVVVDNGSAGRSAVRRICSFFDVDRVIENSANLGVAAGRNQ